jgi:hypothetical protein
VAFPHATAHLQQLAADASRKTEYGQLKKSLQQSGEIAEQTQEKMQAAAMKQQQAAEQWNQQ